METRRPAHPNVRINQRIDALTALCPGFHAWMLPPSAADRNLHICPVRREFPTITLSRSEEVESPESSQWMVLRCAGVVASRSASRTVVADFASTSSSIDAKPWSGPKLPRAPIDLEIAQQDAAQLWMIKRTRNEAGRLSACRGRRSEMPAGCDLPHSRIG